MKLEITEKEIADLKKIKNYFGENDKTSFEHFAYKVLDDILKKTKLTSAG